MIGPSDHDALDQALALTRAELSPSSADKARLRSALGLPAATLAAPPTGGAAAPRSRALTGLRASGKLGASLAALLFGAGVATGWGLHRAAPRAPEGALSALSAPAGSPALAAAPPLAPAPARATPGAPESASAPEATSPAHVEHGASRARAHALPAPARPASKPVETELALLRRVERALRNGDPTFALALLGELDERFPQTRLGEERWAARTLAECRLDPPDALARAREFLQEHPASVYSERIQGACALETNGAGSGR
jgi:hypothetical protein